MPLDAQAKLAISQTDPEMISWVFGNGPTPEDSYLYQRLGGDYGKYEEMLLDPQVRGKLGERVGALLGRSVLVDAATGSDQDKKAADTAKRIIDGNLVPYENVCASFLLSGLIIGFSVQAVTATEEKVILTPIFNDAGEFVKTEKQTVLVPRLEFVPQRRFVFRYYEPQKLGILNVNDEELDPETDIVKVNGYELRLLTKRSPRDGERCSKNQFFTYTFGSLKGLPYGYGLGSMIRKFYEIRNECLKSGVLSGDRLGSPPTHGTYPADLDTRDPEIAELIAAFKRLVRAISPNANAVTTNGFQINFLESNTSGHEILKWLYDTSGLEISRAIWGEGSYSEKETGSYAAEQQQSQNRNENFVDSDCNSLDEQLGDSFWRWIGEKNYPKANFPFVRRETFSERNKRQQLIAEEEFRGKRISNDLVLVRDIGLAIAPDAIPERYGKEFSLPQDTAAPTDNAGFSETADFGANVHRYIDWNGLSIGVRNLPGETRFPQFRSAKKLASGYGFIKGYRTEGKAMRCYISPDLLHGEGSDRLYLINQLSPKTGDLDEVKLAIGYPSADAAELAYRREMPESFFGGVREINLADLGDYADFAEGEETDPADAYEERLAQQLAAAYSEAIAPIQQFIEQIASSDATDEEKYRQFVDGIFDLYEQMEPSILADVLGDGLTAGHLTGMWSERVDRPSIS